MMLLYYSLGNTLESYWGAFRYNVYIFSGILFTVIGAFIVNGLIGGITGFGSLYSTYYINMSIFLACASIMPDYQLLLYGIIPIKMKWMAIVYAALVVYSRSSYAGRRISMQAVQSTDVQCAVVLNLTIRHWSSVIVQSVTGIMSIVMSIYLHIPM